MLTSYYENITKIDQREQKSYARILHASPDAPAVDIYVNNEKTVENLKYKDFTSYLELKPGKYNVKVFPAGKKNNPVINTDLEVKPNMILTIAAVGKLRNISLLPIPEPIIPLPQGTVGLKAVHLSPDAPAVDIVLNDNTKLFEDVSFKQYTHYMPLRPGTYNFKVNVAGTNNTALYVPNQTFQPNRFYSFYIVGLVEGEPGLEALTPLDGNSYLKL